MSIIIGRNTADLNSFFIGGFMEKVLASLANMTGALGIALCLISGISRIMGEPYMLGYQAMTIFNGGIGLMVFASLAKLDVLIRNSSQ